MAMRLKRIQSMRDRSSVLSHLPTCCLYIVVAPMYLFESNVVSCALTIVLRERKFESSVIDMSLTRSHILCLTLLMITGTAYCIYRELLLYAHYIHLHSNTGSRRTNERGWRLLHQVMNSQCEI